MSSAARSGSRTNDYSIGHFIENAVETLTHFDYRSLRAVKWLFIRPVPLSERDAFPFAAAKRAMAAHAQASHGLDDSEFAREFDRTVITQAKSWIFVMISLFATALAVVYGFKRYFFEHLIFATHLYAFPLAWIIVAAVALAVGVYAITGMGIARAGADGLVSIAIVAGLFVYLYVALRRVYGDGRLAAALRALALGALWLPTLETYRLLLFFITLRLMH